jgi:signal transduction histidine kinase
MITELARGITALDRKGIGLQTHLAPDLPLVIADGEKIERVLANLLDNAFKHTPREGKVTIAARQVGEAVQVSVADTGPGISPEERERIFERFAQTNGERPRRRGYGLGLAYCRLAVEAHGGRIWMEAGDGGAGSRFVFELPLVPS